MNEKLYRSSPAAGKLLRPSRAPLHGHNLGFKRAPKKRLRVSHFQNIVRGVILQISTVYSSVGH